MRIGTGCRVFIGLLLAEQSKAVSAVAYHESEETMKKLVFIEGVFGVGKSATAVKLRDTLNDYGFRAVCHLEGNADNPVDFFNCAYLTKDVPVADSFELIKDIYKVDDTSFKKNLDELTEFLSILMKSFEPRPGNSPSVSACAVKSPLPFYIVPKLYFYMNQQ